MTSDDLSPDQCDALSAQIRPMLGYLGRLSKRMAKTGFPRNDPLRVLVSNAEDAVHRLRIHAHYMAVAAHRKAADESSSSNCGSPQPYCKDPPNV
jgi:hypothetical protein